MNNYIYLRNFFKEIDRLKICYIYIYMKCPSVLICKWNYLLNYSLFEKMSNFSNNKKETVEFSYISR